MSGTGGSWYSDLVVGTGRLLVAAASPSRSHSAINVRVFAIALAAATLAACAGPPPVVGNKSDWGAAGRRTQADNRRAAPATLRTARHIPSATNTSSYGVASFYKDDTETASGEKFDPQQLTAAHRTLPFGTRLRVTNVTTGQ